MILPKGITLKNFAASLIIDFPNDNIPILTDEKKWKKWGSLVVQETTFANNGAPGPGRFKDATQWTQALFKTMASF